MFVGVAIDLDHFDQEQIAGAALLQFDAVKTQPVTSPAIYLGRFDFEGMRRSQ